MMHSAKSSKLRPRATKELRKDVNRNHIEHEVQGSSVDQFEGSELEATIKVESYTESDGDLVANIVKSELIEYQDNTSTEIFNQISDIKLVTLEKIATTTETKILGDEPTFSSDKEDYIHFSESDLNSDPEHDPFGDVDCDPYFVKNLSNRSNSECSATQLHELINSAGDVISNSNVEDSSKNFLPSTNTPKHYNLRSKTLSSKFKCQLCLETHITQRKLESHIEICTAFHKNRFRFCVPCTKLFPSAHNFRHHASIFHGIENPTCFSKSFKCKVCPRSFFFRSSFLVHSVLHQESSTTNGANLNPKPFSSRPKKIEETERVNNLPVITNVYSVNPDNFTQTDNVLDVNYKQETCSAQSGSMFIKLANPDIYLDPVLRLEPERGVNDHVDLSKYCQVKLEDNFILDDLPSTPKFTSISGAGILHAPLNSKIVSSAVPAAPATPTARKHFKCKLCSKLLTSLSQLKVHLQQCVTHPKNRNRFCVPCNEIFPDSWKLRHHNRRLHPTQEDKAEELNVEKSKECSKMKCELCPQEFVAAAELRKHVDLHKKVPIEPVNKSLLHVFTCEDCSLFFRTENQLTQHKCTINILAFNA